MMTTIKTAKRTNGWTALVHFPWGALVRVMGYATKADAVAAAQRQIDRKRAYTLDRDM
jgi:hypothetical protein